MKKTVSKQKGGISFFFTDAKRGVTYTAQNVECRVDVDPEIHAQIHGKLVVNDYTEVLQTLARWWVDGIVTFDDEPTMSRLVRFIHANMKVLKMKHPSQSYGEKRLRHFMDEFVDELKDEFAKKIK